MAVCMFSFFWGGGGGGGLRGFPKDTITVTSIEKNALQDTFLCHPVAAQCQYVLTVSFNFLQT